MNKLILGIIAAFFIGAHVCMARQALTQMSPTYDEPIHLTSGYVYLKTGKYEINGYGHPPFSEMWAAAPLLFLNTFLPVHHPAWRAQQWNAFNQYQFADTFLHKNRVHFEKLLFSGRMMQVLLSIVLGLAMAWAALALGGPVAALATLGLWAFSPSILSQASVISTDLSFATFFFLFFVLLTRPRSPIRDMGAGICLALTFASKFPAIATLPILAACLVWDPKVKFKNFMSKERLTSFLFISVTFLATLLIVYQVKNLDVFWAGLMGVFKLSQSGRSSFLLGEHGTKGWLYYFVATFFIKTPLPIIIGFIGALILAFIKKLKWPAVLWIPPVSFFIIASFSNVHIGHRHILLVYPFIFLFMGVMISKIELKKQIILAPLFIWLMATTWIHRPYFLAYFNETVGGPSKGYQYLTDSNVDWGQGLKSLGEALSAEEKEKGIYLCYFGVADPHAYDIRYIDIFSDRITNRQDDRALIQGQPHLFAISVTNIQSTYYPQKDVFKWLEKYEPVQQLAHSIFVYDFSGHPEAIKQLDLMRRT